MPAVSTASTKRASDSKRKCSTEMGIEYAPEPNRWTNRRLERSEEMLSREHHGGDQAAGSDEDEVASRDAPQRRTVLRFGVERPDHHDGEGEQQEEEDEDSINLTPRLMFDRDQRVTSRALNRDTPFACIACGKPFAPSSVIDKMLDKLKDHHMFTNQRALDRLKMCDDCRVVDIVQDPEALGGQFDPLKNFRQ